MDDVSVVRAGPSRWARLGVLAVMLSVLAAGLWPMTWAAGRDSFPLTSYPMFSHPRSGDDVVLVVALGVTLNWTTPLPTESTGHRQLTQAVRALRHAADEGGDRPDRLCREIADWVAENGAAEVLEVRIVTASYDALDFLVRGDRRPDVLKEHARCPVR